MTYNLLKTEDVYSLMTHRFPLLLLLLLPTKCAVRLSSSHTSASENHPSFKAGSAFTVRLAFFCQPRVIIMDILETSAQHPGISDHAGNSQTMET